MSASVHVPGVPHSLDEECADLLEWLRSPRGRRLPRGLPIPLASSPHWADYCSWTRDLQIAAAALLLDLGLVRVTDAFEQDVRPDDPGITVYVRLAGGAS